MDYSLENTSDLTHSLTLWKTDLSLPRTILWKTPLISTQICSNLQEADGFNIILEMKIVAIVTNFLLEAKGTLFLQLRCVKYCTCRLDISRKLLHMRKLETSDEHVCKRSMSFHLRQTSFSPFI